MAEQLKNSSSPSETELLEERFELQNQDVIEKVAQSLETERQKWAWQQKDEDIKLCQLKAESYDIRVIRDMQLVGRWGDMAEKIKEVESRIDRQRQVRDYCSERVTFYTKLIQEIKCSSQTFATSQVRKPRLSETYI